MVIAAYPSTAISGGSKEAPTPASLLADKPKITQLADVSRVPKEYWKSTLLERRRVGKLPEIEWDKRAMEVENYIQRVLQSQTDIVAEVKLDDDDRDSEGPDARILLVAEFPISEVAGEFKSSRSTLEAYKQELRDEYLERQIRETLIGPWPEDTMKSEMKKKLQEWNQKTDSEKEALTSQLLTQEHIILINGGVGKSGIEKTPEKILYNSFYPQLFRIIEAGRENESLEDIYGTFYPGVAAIKQIILERKSNPPEPTVVFVA